MAASEVNTVQIRITFRLRLLLAAHAVFSLFLNQHRGLAVLRGLLVREGPAQQVAVVPRSG
jgi:hypothetical protein